MRVSSDFLNKNLTFSLHGQKRTPHIATLGAHVASYIYYVGICEIWGPSQCCGSSNVDSTSRLASALTPRPVILLYKGGETLQNV